MGTTVTEKDLSEYTNKRVVVTRNLPTPNENGESAIETEGLVQVGSELGLLIKPKGKVQFDLIPMSEIEDIRLADNKVKKLKASKIKLLKVGQARRHLLERHGVTLEWANSITEEQASDYHDSLDHVELDLGHVHVEDTSDVDNEDDD